MQRNGIVSNLIVELLEKLKLLWLLLLARFLSLSLSSMHFGDDAKESTEKNPEKCQKNG